MYAIRPYRSNDQKALFTFLRTCLPESGRVFCPEGRHSMYLQIDKYFFAFWCLFDGTRLIGTVGLKSLSATACELKALYLYQQYHGRGLGRKLAETAIAAAQERGCTGLYLDSLSTSRRALTLYRRLGFVNTVRYNDNPHADIFMYLPLQSGPKNGFI